MKAILFLLVFGVLLMGGCDTHYVQTRKMVSKTKTVAYTINTAGPINEKAYFSANTLVGSLLNGEYNNVKIEKFTIRNVEVSVVQNAGNKAQAVSVSTVYVTGFESGVMMRENDFDITTSAGIEVAGFLAFGGLQKINTTITNNLKGLNKDDLLFNLIGNAKPANTRAILTLNMIISYDLVFTHCVDDFGGYLGGEDCK
jgi:uncharacterized membrane protein YbjE (DUF340 family)